MKPKTLPICVFICILTLLVDSCKTETSMFFCPLVGIDDPVKIGDMPAAQSEPKSLLPAWTLSYNPMILPFKLKFNTRKGFYVESSDNVELATPLGIFGLDYSYASSGTVNGVEITNSDFVVSIVNRNTNTQQLFKIKGYNKLKVVLSGKTTIDAQSGFVQIDVTDARINEISFFDNSRACIENTTDTLVRFHFVISASSLASSSDYTCQIPPKSYRMINLKSLNVIMNQQVAVKINNDDASNDTENFITKKVGYGDLCLIYSDGSKLNLKKLRNTITAN